MEHFAAPGTRGDELRLHAPRYEGTLRRLPDLVRHPRNAGEEAATRGARWLFHQVCFKAPPARGPTTGALDYEFDNRSAQRFLGRFGRELRFENKSVLDVGCGTGVLCVEAARRGAERVLGVDIQPVEPANTYLHARHPDVEGRVRFVRTDGLGHLPEEAFDLVLSKDSFEHYREPERLVGRMAELLRPGGELVIGFGPLWKSPLGGHITYMTRLPWAHLLFSERVIMAERRRFRPDESATRFADVVGGLNKMTLGRFRGLMEGRGLECIYWATNASEHPVVRAMDAFARIPPLREYFTNNVYTIWRKP